MTPRERAEAVLAEALAPRRVSYAVTIAELYGADLARDLIAAEDALDASRAEAERLRGALARAVRSLRGLLLARDCAWTGGNDWEQAVAEACESYTACDAALAPATEGT